MYWLDPISYTLYGLVVGELGDNEDLMAVSVCRWQLPPLLAHPLTSRMPGCDACRTRALPSR